MCPPLVVVRYSPHSGQPLSRVLQDEKGRLPGRNWYGTRWSPHRLFLGLIGTIGLASFAGVAEGPSPGPNRQPRGVAPQVPVAASTRIRGVGCRINRPYAHGDASANTDPNTHTILDGDENIEQRGCRNHDVRWNAT